MSRSETQELLYGRNPVLETLRANRRAFQALTVQENLEPSLVVQEILKQAELLSIPIAQRSRKDLDLRLKHHQGVLLQASPYPYVALNEVLAHVKAMSEPALLLLLDQLKDPQNLGTLLRTAEAVGVHGVLLPARHTVGVTPAVVSASSGASEHLRICRVNLAQAMRVLKQQDIWMVGLERGEASRRLDQVDLQGPVGLVVGSEGDGLRSLVQKSCDFLVDIPMRGKVDSLNAAVAGSLALYRIWEQRGY